VDFGRHQAHAPFGARGTPTAFTAAVAFAVAAVAAVLGAVGEVSAIAAIAVAAGCAVLAFAPAAIARHDRSVLRGQADRLLRQGVRVHSASALLRWREAELTSERTRKSLARSLKHVVKELEGQVLPGAVPLIRAAARPHVDLIRVLAERLATLERPVTAQGMLLANDFVTDGIGSPLYVRERAGELESTVERCLAALDDPEVLARQNGRPR
jgi:hypothetical protein